MGYSPKFRKYGIFLQHIGTNLFSIQIYTTENTLIRTKGQTVIHKLNGPNTQRVFIKRFNLYGNEGFSFFLIGTANDN